MKVNFSRPRHGWIELQIDGDDGNFNEAISCTPNNFLFELTTAHSLGLQGVSAEALAYCEPVLFVFTISVVPDSGECLESNNLQLEPWKATFSFLLGPARFRF